MTVPDWLYALVEAFVNFMDRLTLVDTVALLAAGTLAVPFAVLIHEVGHALAAVVLRRKVSELTVGDDQPLLTLRAGGLQLRLGSVTGKGDAGGFIVYEDDLASPRATLAIALAGPVASLLGGLATAAAMAWTWGSVGPAWFFGVATLAGLSTGIASLQISGDSPTTWSDGVWARGAWRAMRRRAPVSK